MHIELRMFNIAEQKRAAERTPTQSSYPFQTLPQSMQVLSVTSPLLICVTHTIGTVLGNLLQKVFTSLRKERQTTLEEMTFAKHELVVS
jgi:hypothetical protein